MKMKYRSNFGTITLAAFVGGLAGAAVGLMFAPKSGKELRQGMREKADTVLDRAEGATLQRAGETLKKQGGDLVDKGKELAEDLQSFIQESLKSRKSSTVPVNTPNDPLDVQAEELPESPIETPSIIYAQTENPPREG